MGLLPTVILTKKEKLKRLQNDIYDFARIQSFFRGVHPNLEARFTEKQHTTFQYLTHWKATHNNDNDVQYDEIITQSVSFLREILSLIDKPIVFANGHEMEPFEKRYSFIDNPEHDRSHIGSRYSTHSPDGHIIRKLDKTVSPTTLGYTLCFERNHYDVEPWLEEMGKGSYTINDYRFDVGRFTSFGYNYFTDITIWEEEKDSHPILMYIQPSKEPIEQDEVYCSTCGDGGCFHCEPQRFIR